MTEDRPVDRAEFQRLDRFEMPAGFRGKPGWYVQLWWIVQATLFAASPQFMYGWRRWLLRAFGAEVGKDVIVRPTARTQFPWKVKIGDYSWIGDDVVLYSLGPITIGANAVLSQRTYVCTGSHDPNALAFDIYAEPIVIGEQCWLATDVFVGPGVTIGRGTLVGARSSVYGDLGAGLVAVGNPARVRGERNGGPQP